MAETLDPVLPREVQERANRVLELACDKERYLAINGVEHSVRHALEQVLLARLPIRE